jgi:hypothetical protein
MYCDRYGYNNGGYLRGYSDGLFDARYQYGGYGYGYGGYGYGYGGYGYGGYYGGRYYGNYFF